MVTWTKVVVAEMVKRIEIHFGRERFWRLSRCDLRHGRKEESRMTPEIFELNYPKYGVIY